MRITFVSRFVRLGPVTQNHSMRNRSSQELLSALKENIENMQRASKDLEADEKALDAKVFVRE